MGIYVYIGIGILGACAILAFFLTGKSEGPALAAPAPGSPEKAPDQGAGERVSRAPQSRRPEAIRPEAPRPMPIPSDAPSDAQYMDDGVDDTAPNPFILVTAVGRSDPGKKRKHNEDSYLVMDEKHLFVVADGMGRHAAGEIASRLATDTVGDCFARNDFGDTPFDSAQPKEVNRLRAAFHRANKTVFAAATEVEAYQGMGTTMVALHFSPNKARAAIAHAGDSRCYRLRGTELNQLTTDHTLGAAGIVGPSANVLSKAVGIEEGLEPDVLIDHPEPGDIYLICSDGLSRMASHEEIAAILSSHSDLDKSANALIDVANQAGGRDNVTVILVRVDRAKIPGLRA
jgi:serine/threonine protein phosphatase PrpC